MVCTFLVQKPETLFGNWNSNIQKKRKDSILSHMHITKIRKPNWTHIYSYKKKDDIQIWNYFLLIVIAQIIILTQTTTSNNRTRMWKQFFLAFQSLIIRKRQFIFSALISISSFPYSPGVNQSQLMIQMFVSVSSQIHTEIIIIFVLLIFFLVWVLFYKNFELEEQITAFFQWYFPFRKIPMKQLFRFFSFISGITYLDAFTGGTRRLLCVAGQDPALGVPRATWKRYCSLRAFPPGPSLPKPAIKQSSA